jgi:hypothetical protein
MEDRSSKESAQRQRQRGNAIKVPMESLVPDLSKITKTERITMVLMHVWLSGFKVFLDTNSRF